MVLQEGSARLAFGEGEGGEVSYRIASGGEGREIPATLSGGFSLLFLCWRAGGGSLALNGERIGFRVTAFRGTEIDVALDRLPAQEA